MRRGVAMLVVLAALAIGIVAAVAAARVATDHALLRRLDASEAAADDALSAAEARVAHWLRAESKDAVVPPDALEPAVAVEHAVIGTRLSVRITAFDQHGMLPWDAAAKGAPLARAALPQDAADAIARAQVPRGTPPGIDLAGEGMRRPRWPSHAAVEPIAYGGAEASAEREAKPSEPALAALVSTHLSGGAVEINVCTAPVALLEEAERVTQQSVAGPARQARAAGRKPPLPARPSAQPGANAAGTSSAVRFVGASDCWSFRIDIQSGPVARSWWATYRETADGWRCVQRLRIDP